MTRRYSDKKTVLAQDVDSTEGGKKLFVSHSFARGQYERFSIAMRFEMN